MRVSIDLASFIGAEEVTFEGQKGIFIPYVPNCNVVPVGRRKLVMSSIKFFSSASKKSFDMKGRLFIPKEHLDRCISDPRLVRKRNTVAWAWLHDNYGEGVVSREDFDNIIADD